MKVVEYKNIFTAGAPWPHDPFAAFRTDPAPQTVSNLERRATMAARALAQAEDDLDTEKRRRGMAAEDDARAERISRVGREATMTERKRILTILDAPVAVRQPRLARKFVDSAVPAREAIEAMEDYERENAASNAKATADKIVHMGKVRRGEVDAPVTGVGPKNLIRATSEDILRAAARARGED
jgi:hypothetical protein